MNESLYKKFLDLCGQLSPENLTCDGELSAAQVRVRVARIKKQWRALEAQAGHEVSEDEIWNMYIQKNRDRLKLGVAANSR